MKKAELRWLVAWWQETANRNATMLDDRLTRVAELETENAQLRTHLTLALCNVQEQEEERATELSRARTKELADSLRISDLLRERDGWRRDYYEMKTRRDEIETKWCKLNRDLDDWDELYWEG